MKNKTWHSYYKALTAFGENENGGIDRLAYSETDQAAHRWLAEQATAAGMKIHWDDAGNLWMTKPGANSGLPPLVFGSHLDAVPNGGKYDGALGVMMALFTLLNRKETVLQREVTVIAFRCEESSRFNCATIGSKLLTGKLTEEALQRYTDDKGNTPAEVIKALGGQLRNFSKEREYLANAEAFVEVHIEQGPILESSGTDIGAVIAIAAPARLKIDVIGTAAHSGACPMSLRRDALTGAAELILEIESIGRKYEQDHIVATVGKCNVLHQAMNVVPGHVELYVDIRGLDSEMIARAEQEICNAAKRLNTSRGLDTTVTLLSREAPVVLNEALGDWITELCNEIGLSSVKMMSGAGHDAMNIATVTKTAMIFLPCKEGVSHNPAEDVSETAIEKGLQLLETILRKKCM